MDHSAILKRVRGQINKNAADLSERLNRMGEKAIEDLDRSIDRFNKWIFFVLTLSSSILALASSAILGTSQLRYDWLILIGISILAINMTFGLYHTSRIIRAYQSDAHNQFTNINKIREYTTQSLRRLFQKIGEALQKGTSIDAETKQWQQDLGTYVDGLKTKSSKRRDYSLEIMLVLFALGILFILIAAGMSIYNRQSSVPCEQLNKTYSFSCQSIDTISHSVEGRV